MKINHLLIEKIFNLKVSLIKKNDKIKLSQYEKIIPMYDIYSNKIYPIDGKNVNYRLIHSHYRFLSEDLFDWIKLMNKKAKKNKDNELLEKSKYNLKIYSNYDLETLKQTSINVYYKYNPELGLNISICKRESFHPFIKHFTPYYTKNEIIKLGLNMKILKENVDYNLSSKKTHYEVCKKISHNDISIKEIIDHTNYIIQNNAIYFIKFHTLNGSYLVNQFLRNPTERPSELIIKQIDSMKNILNNSPPFKKKYIVYRFILNDSFLKNLKVGNIFTDNGIISTTRDSFYSPGLEGDFGVILLKIHLPKNKKGTGLLIENFSLYPKENEIILPIRSKLKLLSINGQFKYYHTNKHFESIINKKYEFEFVGVDNRSIIYPSIKSEIPQLNLLDIDIQGETRIEKIKKFIKLTSDNYEFNLKIGDKICLLQSSWFDGTKSYSKFYYNKIQEGIIFTYYENLIPFLNIEIGQKMIVNFINKFYNVEELFEYSELEETIAYFAKIFNFNQVYYYFGYSDFTPFSVNYDKKTRTFLYLYNYCQELYSLIKTEENLKLNKYWEFEFGFWNLKKFSKTEISKEDLSYFKTKLSTYGELLIDIIENKFYLYQIFIKRIGRIFKNKNNIFNMLYLTFNADKYLIDNKIIYKSFDNIEYNEFIDEDYKVIYNSNIERIN